MNEAASDSSGAAAVAAAWSRDELFPEPRCFLVELRCTDLRRPSWILENHLVRLTDADCTPAGGGCTGVPGQA